MTTFYPGLDLLGESCGIRSRRAENRVATLNIGSDVLEPHSAQQAHEVAHRQRIGAANVDRPEQRDVRVRHGVVARGLPTSRRSGARKPSGPLWALLTTHRPEFSRFTG